MRPDRGRPRRAQLAHGLIEHRAGQVDGDHRPGLPVRPDPDQRRLDVFTVDGHDPGGQAGPVLGRQHVDTRHLGPRHHGGLGERADEQARVVEEDADEVQPHRIDPGDHGHRGGHPREAVGQPVVRPQPGNHEAGRHDCEGGAGLAADHSDRLCVRSSPCAHASIMTDENRCSKGVRPNG